MSRLASTILMAMILVAQALDARPQTIGAQSQITGTWRGNSECVLKSSACHDETNVYRFSEVAARPGWFSCTGSKVVNGKEISMGKLDWHYDAKSHILESNNPNGVFRLVVNGDKMEGALLLPDATVYRRIHLTKAR